MKYKVYGKTEVYIEYTCEAENEEEAMDIAAQEIGGLTSYCGNGGFDKLVGISDSDGGIYPADEIEWENAEPIEDGD